jgi:uncharacterized membrane protein YdjX (TVP38/TMEM64 family)
MKESDSIIELTKAAQAQSDFDLVSSVSVKLQHFQNISEEEQQITALQRATTVTNPLSSSRRSTDDSVDLLISDTRDNNNNTGRGNTSAMAPRLTKMKIGVGVMVIVTLIIIVYYASDNIPFHLIEDACNWIKRNMLIGALLFIPIEVIWTVLCIPTTPIELAAGYTFGFGYGFLVDCIAKLIGAALSFFLGRYCLHNCAGASSDMFQGEKGKMFKAIDAALTNNKDAANTYESFKLLLLIQLAYIPVSIKNYGLSLTSVEFSYFISSALIGESPGTLALTWTGSTTRDLVALMSGEEESSQTQVIVLILGLICLVLCMIVLGVRIKKQLDQTLNVEPYAQLHVV